MEVETDDKDWNTTFDRGDFVARVHLVCIQVAHEKGQNSHILYFCLQESRVYVQRQKAWTPCDWPSSVLHHVPHRTAEDHQDSVVPSSRLPDLGLADRKHDKDNL